MASMRKLRRRLLRWDRYAARYDYPPPTLIADLSWYRPLSGHRRAFKALVLERGIRTWDRPRVPVVTVPVDRRML